MPLEGNLCILNGFFVSWGSSSYLLNGVCLMKSHFVFQRNLWRFEAALMIS